MRQDQILLICPDIAKDREQMQQIWFKLTFQKLKDGAKLLSNFTYKICGAKGNWTMAKFKDDAIKTIQQQVGSEKVVCGLSGGVDSTVVAALIYEAIGDQLTCVFVDNGLMRQDESKKVVSLFRENYNVPLIQKASYEPWTGLLTLKRKER